MHPFSSWNDGFFQANLLIVISSICHDTHRFLSDGLCMTGNSKFGFFGIGNRFDVFSFFLLEKCWLYLQVYLHCGTMKNHQMMGDKWRTHTIPDFSKESKTKITTSIPITSLVWTDNRRRGILPLFALPWAQLKYQSQFFIIWFWLGGE